MYTCKSFPTIFQQQYRKTEKQFFNVPQVRTLEGRLTEARRSEAVDYEKEARKFKLKYEILARNEINKKVSELNDFLGQRAKDQEVENLETEATIFDSRLRMSLAIFFQESEKSREEAMDRIQRDLGDRLQMSREELGAIKNQMKGER